MHQKIKHKTQANCEWTVRPSGANPFSKNTSRNIKFNSKATSINGKKYYSQIRANPFNKNTSQIIKFNFTKHKIQLKSQRQQASMTTNTAAK